VSAGVLEAGAHSRIELNERTKFMQSYAVFRILAYDCMGCQNERMANDERSVRLRDKEIDALYGIISQSLNLLLFYRRKGKNCRLVILLPRLQDGGGEVGLVG